MLNHPNTIREVAEQVLERELMLEKQGYSRKDIDAEIARMVLDTSYTAAEVVAEINDIQFESSLAAMPIKEI